MKTEQISEEKATRTKIIDLLNKSEKFVCMSTGLHPLAFGDPEVKRAFTGAANKLKEFKLLIDVDDLESRKESLPWLFELQTSTKLKIRTKPGVPHWIISDGKHFRIEKPHSLERMGIKNLIVYDMDSSVSDVLQFTFEEWWNNGEPLE